MKLIVIVVTICCAATVICENIKRLSLPTGRIVGGQDANPNSAPFIVSLQYFLNHFCGGSIIDDQWVLTAAHCVGRPSALITVVAGLHSLTNRLNSQSRRVDFIIVHEKYEGNVGPYDIALMHVTRPFPFNLFVSKIQLPQSGIIHDGNVTLFGWGKTSNRAGESPKILQTVVKPIIEFKQCEDVLGGPGASPLHESNLCTGPLTGGISACSGDSGGPLTKDRIDGNQELAGIVSWGYVPCGTKNSPSVYTRTSAFIEWIEENSKGI